MNQIFKWILNIFPRPWLIRLSLIFKPFIILFFKGNNYYDPIDQKGYRTLLPYGYGPQRKNALAPGSLSLERHRLMWLYLKNETKFFSKPLKVLHIAPEQSFYKIFKGFKNLDYTTADLNSPIADIQADLLNLPFNNNSFDVIFCNHVLEHIEDDKRAMKELYRVMKPGGWGIFQVPMKTDLKKTYEDFSIKEPAERKIHFGQYDHVRWYGQDYFLRLKKSGFIVKRYAVLDHFSSEQIKKMALMEDEILPIVQKPNDI